MVASSTSGPMPSPGTRSSLYSFMAESVFSCGLQPGLRRGPGLFEAVDLVFGAHGQADIVPAIQQALLAERIDVELDGAAIGAANLLRFQVDGDDGVGTTFGVIHQLVDVGLRQLDRQDAVLEAVAIKDVGKAGRDN